LILVKFGHGLAESDALVENELRRADLETQKVAERVCKAILKVKAVVLGAGRLSVRFISVVRIAHGERFLSSFNNLEVSLP
jgi:hypothetical protein